MNFKAKLKKFTILKEHCKERKTESEIFCRARNLNVLFNFKLNSRVAYL